MLRPTSVPFHMQKQNVKIVKFYHVLTPAPRGPTLKQKIAHNKRVIISNCTKFLKYRQVQSLRHQTMILFSGIERQYPVGGKTSISTIMAYGKSVLNVSQNSQFLIEYTFDFVDLLI